MSQLTGLKATYQANRKFQKTGFVHMPCINCHNHENLKANGKTMAILLLTIISVKWYHQQKWSSFLKLKERLL